LGTINEFWNASKKRMLMICGRHVFAQMGLVTEMPRNNVAVSDGYHFQRNAGSVSYRMAYAGNQAALQSGPNNAWVFWEYAAQLGDSMRTRGRDRYELAAASELKMLTERLDSLRALAERTSGERRFALERSLDAVRGFRNRCEAKIEDVRRASDDAWQLVKVHADAALAQFRSGLDQIESQFRQIAA
jgi:hypothetical protein